MNPHQLLYPLLNAKKRRYPFSHLFIHPFFPEEFYKKMVQFFPAATAFETLAKKKEVVVGYSEKRGVMPLSKEAISSLPKAQGDFWEEMRALLLDSGFGEAILAFFHDELKEAIQRGSLRQSAELVFDTSGYKLDVHTDHPNKLLTLIFYLPSDDSLKEAGTALFAPKKEIPASKEYTMYPYEYFDHVATMPFIPNALFGFVRSDSSWHGVMPIEKENIERRSLCYRITLG